MKEFIEPLESRRLLYALIPSGYSAIETVQIRPKAATYASDVTLLKGVQYFIRAEGKAVTSTNTYDGDAAFATGSTTAATTWGLSVIAGSTTGTSADWGGAQGDHIYKQYITPTANESISFAFANDSKVAASTLAVTIYGPVPSIQVAKIRTNKAIGFLSSASLKSTGIFIPLNDSDWDRNGSADNKQTGAVKGDQFLLPVTLPAVTGATSKSHYVISAPSGVRVWLNSDRTGKASGIGLRATKARTVYLEGNAEQINTAAVMLNVSIPYSGTHVVQQVPVTVFRLAGPTTSFVASKEVYSSNSPKGNWSTAVGGTLDTGTINQVHGVAFANITWHQTGTGYADFTVSKDYIWGLGVGITAPSA